jgi:glycosyltransferase involved in cell wall biosynthesis
MTKLPLVSIIVNNYNYGRFVGEAIDSALAQTYPNVEVIVVDDGSTDNSREVIKSRGEKIRAFFKPNGGHASAFNAGFEVSSGDLVLFLDSDDMLEPNAIETVVREWRDGFSRMHYLLQVIDAKGEPVGGTVGGLVSPSPLVGPFISGASTTGNVHSRAALEKIMPIPEEDWKMAADYYVCATSPLFGEVRRLGQPLGKYRIHGQNDHLSATHSLARIRRSVDLNFKLYCELARLTDWKIGSIERWLGTYPEHWIRRITSLRESPHDHPWPDSFTGLTVRAVKATWRRPSWGFRRRLAYTLYAIACGSLPKKLARLLKRLVPVATIAAVKADRVETETMARAAELSKRGTPA